VNRLIHVPDDVSIPVALALTTMGLTAHYLCSSIGKLQPGDNGKPRRAPCTIA
jgi:hypothetical protein